MKKRIIMIALIIILIGLVFIFLFKENNEEELTDALKFKEEYESLNGTIRQSDGAYYNSVDVAEDNSIKYVTVTEAVEIIKNETAIIYFGANWCPWCRNAVEVLFDAAKDNSINTIYYLDMTEVRNIWEVQDGALVKTQKEEDGYYELLEVLDSILDDETYTVTDSDGNVYDTEEKRVYMPLVISVSNGNILSSHDGTVTLNDDQNKYDKLTDEQYTSLYNTYDKLIKTIVDDNNASVCTDEDCS